MLNPFPIQFLAPLAYTLMRICVGLILVRLGRRNLHNRATLQTLFTFRLFPYGNFFVLYMSLLEIVLGLMFIFGFLTQIAALLLIVFCLKFMIMHKRFDHPLLPKRLSYLLLCICGLSLFITGAGAFAIDLPI